MNSLCGSLWTYQMIMNRVEIWQMLSGEYKGEDESECICIIMMVVLTQNAPLMIIFRMCLLLLTQGNLRSMPISSHIFIPCVYQWRIRTLILSSANSQQTDWYTEKHPKHYQCTFGQKKSTFMLFVTFCTSAMCICCTIIHLDIANSIYHKANESRIRSERWWGMMLQW